MIFAIKEIYLIWFADEVEMMLMCVCNVLQNEIIQRVSHNEYFFKNYHFPKKCLYEYKTASVLTSDNVSFEIKFYFFKSLD